MLTLQDEKEARRYLVRLEEHDTANSKKMKGQHGENGKIIDSRRRMGIEMKHTDAI